MKVLVAYDGTIQAKDALKYGMQKVKESGGELVALHIFNSNLFVDYDVFGAEEAGRTESMRFAAEARKILEEAGKGIKARVIVGEGNPEEEIMKYARENNVDVLLCAPSYKSIIRSFKKLLDEQGKKAQEDISFDEKDKPKTAIVSQQ